MADARSENTAYNCVLSSVKYTVILSVSAFKFKFKTYDVPAHQKFGRLHIAYMMQVHVKQYFLARKNTCILASSSYPLGLYVKYLS